MEKLKASLAHIRDRATVTGTIMTELSTGWSAPNFISPGNFEAMVTTLTAHANDLVEKETLTALAAGVWDGVLTPWHAASVAVLKIGRGSFKGTDKAPVWRPLRAKGGGREVITAEGIAIEKAWKASGITWSPKPPLTYGSFCTFATNATVMAGLHTEAVNDESMARGVLNDLANSIYELSIRWYEMATGAFGPDTPQGSLIRTIPTYYDPDEAPGRMRFTQHYSPAPNRVQLAYEAPRGTRFTIWAKAPGASTWMKLLDEVTFKTWMGEGLPDGEWKFQGEAKNAHGQGDTSLEVIIPVAALAVA